MRKARAASPIPAAIRPAAIALLRPLVEAGLLPADYPVTVNAVSGYSGGGRSMIEAYEAGTAPAFELYGLGFEHKHLPELQQYAKLDAPADLRALGRQLPPGHAGERAAAPRHAARQAHGARPRGGARQALRRRQAGEGGAGRRCGRQGQRLEPEALNDTDMLELRVYASDKHGQAVLVARLDNLGKGASGAAVQNMGLMLGVAT